MLLPSHLEAGSASSLYLWLVVGLSDREVRGDVCAWRVCGRARGSAQLYRWTRRAADLFVLPRMLATTGSAKDVALRVLVALRSLAPVALHASPIALQVFEGASLRR